MKQREWRPRLHRTQSIQDRRQGTNAALQNAFTTASWQEARALLPAPRSSDRAQQVEASDVRNKPAPIGIVANAPGLFYIEKEQNKKTICEAILFRSVKAEIRARYPVVKKDRAYRETPPWFVSRRSTICHRLRNEC